MSSKIPTAALVQRLRATGLGELAAALLESAGPVGWLGAQALHFSAPVLSLFTPTSNLEALADMLEDPEAAQALARALTEDGQA